MEVIRSVQSGLHPHGVSVTANYGRYQQPPFCRLPNELRPVQDWGSFEPLTNRRDLFDGTERVFSSLFYVPQLRQPFETFIAAVSQQVLPQIFELCKSPPTLYESGYQLHCTWRWIKWAAWIFQLDYVPPLLQFIYIEFPELPHATFCCIFVGGPGWWVSKHI